MGKKLNEVAKDLINSNKKTQLIYAFNGTGKTRLSRELKNLVSFKSDIDAEETGLASKRILYYNAFTEDLFYWDNDLENDMDLKLKIHPNTFTDWVFKEQGQELNVISHFQEYTNVGLTPKFDPDYSEVTFSLERGNDEDSHNVKISKGEESNFVWTIFYSLLEMVVDILNVLDPIERETDKFNQLKFIFIDDPVTSLDDNHLIQMAVDLANLIKKSEFQNGLRFIITTHSSLFYNVLFNELGTKNGYMLRKNEDGSYDLDTSYGDSNRNFSYHQYLIGAIRKAIDQNKIEKYHFTMLRNLYEKAANFLGYQRWSDLLPDDKEVYASRIMNFYSHRTLMNDEVREPTDPEKQMIKLLYNHLIENSRFWTEV